MSTVKLRCGECGSEGEFAIHGGSEVDRMDHQSRVYARWVDIHAPCLESSIAANHSDAPPRVDGCTCTLHFSGSDPECPTCVLKQQHVCSCEEPRSAENPGCRVCHPLGKRDGR